MRSRYHDDTHQLDRRIRAPTVPITNFDALKQFCDTPDG